MASEKEQNEKMVIWWNADLIDFYENAKEIKFTPTEAVLTFKDVTTISQKDLIQLIEEVLPEGSHAHANASNNTITIIANI